MKSQPLPAIRRPDVHRRHLVLPFLAATCTTLATFAAPVAAAGPSFTSGTVTVERLWSRATPMGADVAVGYLTIRNTGDAPDRLVSASSAIAGRVGPHSMVSANGVMRMRPIPQGITIPPHGTTVLAPNGDHLMFEALRRPLKVDERFPATLTFEKAGAVPVTFEVEAIGARSQTAPLGADVPPAGGMNMKMD